MLTRLDLRGAPDVRSALPRPEVVGDAPIAAVSEIIADVRVRGDVALRELTERFDRVAIDDLRVPDTELKAALEGLAPDLRAALQEAAERITTFHRHQLRSDGVVDDAGIRVRERFVPVQRAGVYVPGGRAVYPSTVLMTAIPARVAGVDEVVLCVPPGPDGHVPAVTLAAARIAGVDEVYRVGGAQAIAAMAYGTESIRAVDVIAGPGNIYVALAKRAVAGRVGIAAAFAGPSEVVVVADDTTPVELAAIDVVVQAEHGPDGLAWLVTWSDAVADAVTVEVTRIVEASPRRADIEATLAKGGYAVVVDGPREAIDVANTIAPEHLELMFAGADDHIGDVRNAGAVFIGANAGAALGDYVAGPSHVLPTHGSARFASALRVDDFLKQLHVISVEDDAALTRLGPHVAALADAEGLPAHADSLRRRMKG
jgi:histidinol dehydrogenase